MRNITIVFVMLIVFFMSLMSLDVFLYFLAVLIVINLILSLFLVSNNSLNKILLILKHYYCC